MIKKFAESRSHCEKIHSVIIKGGENQILIVVCTNGQKLHPFSQKNQIGSLKNVIILWKIKISHTLEEKVRKWWGNCRYLAVTPIVV